MIHRVSTPGGGYQGAIGLHVVGDDAMAVPAVNDPFSQAGGDWAMHQFFENEQATDDSKLIVGTQRARRRIGIDFSLAFVFENAAGSDDTVEWGISMRLLLQRNR